MPILKNTQTVSNKQALCLHLSISPSVKRGLKFIVEIQTNHQKAQTYRVSEMKAGTFPLYALQRLARNFINADKLIDSRIASTPIKTDGVDGYPCPVATLEGPDWLPTILWGHLDRELGALVVANFFVPVSCGSREAISKKRLGWPGPLRFARFVLVCRLANAQRFGRELLRECSAAEI